MRERAIRFGRTAALVGVVTEPAAATAPDRPAVLLLNSGILHHVGASRLHVQLARRLAEDGFISLRFDHSGIGDSEPRRDALSFEQSAVVETREAMDHLAAQKGVRSFVLFGLCSGADMAFRVAGADERVVGVVQLDAWAYRTAGYHLRHYGRRMRHGAAWLGLGRRLLARVAKAPAAAGPAEDRPADGETPSYRRRFPPRETVARDLRALVGRGVELLYIFSGGQSEHYNHRGQYRRSFRDVDFGDSLRVEYVAGADHLFSGLAHQRFVLDTVAGWIRARAGRNAPRAPLAPAEARRADDAVPARAG
jgi:hypothetical protein